MNYKIEEIEGIGPAFGEKLKSAKITNTDGFLKHCADAKGRKTVAKETGISEGMLLGWANKADLMRISGIGKQFAELLEASGVDTVKELRNRRPDNLSVKMGEINEQKNLSKSAPSQSMVEKWVAQAKTMDPKISH